MRTKAEHALLVAARKGLRPAPGLADEGWEALRERLDDPTDVPEIPRVPPLAAPPSRTWIAVPVVLAAAVIAWLSLRPHTPVATPASTEEQLAPDQVQHEPDGGHTVPTQPAPAAAAERSPPSVEPVQEQAEDRKSVPPRRKRTAVDTPDQATDETIKEEAALVRGAQLALERGDPGAALRKVKRHAHRFPKGVLAQERWVLHVQALCKLGRTQAAKAKAVEFARLFAGLPLAQKVRDGGCWEPL